MEYLIEHLANYGIYIFEPEVLALVPPRQVYDIGSQLFPQLVAQKLPFYAQKRFFNWIDIGRVSDYWEVLQRMLRGEVAQMNMPGREVKPGASIIGPNWIGHGSRIRAGAQVVRSILFEYTRIGADMCFSEMIVSPTYCVDRHGDTQFCGDERAQLRWGDARG